MKKYTLGIDFGSLSARAALYRLDDGGCAASAVCEYAHAVMDTALPDGTKLEPDTALQHPADYIEALRTTVKQAIASAGADPYEIASVGIDFTASTVLPIKADGTPLCFLEQYKNRPHAYVKMWKSHAAQAYAARLHDLAHVRGEAWLSDYSGQISSEWLFPKLWQILDEDPEIYREMDKFIEAGDWIVMLLTGKEARSASFAGYKALWGEDRGYPSREFLAALDPGLENAVAEKLSEDIRPIGSIAGTVTEKASELTGLALGTPVCTAVIDAHAAFPAAGITSPGRLLMIMGTSNCDLLLGDEERTYRGICGAVKNGMIHGFYGYEAGQACAGDHFDWFVKNLLPEAYAIEARERGISPYQLLAEKAAAKRVGESGLLALDWWNGVRSDLMDENLSGLLLGMTLATRAEDIYRALIEATAFGTRVITENYEKAGVKFDEIYACGGVAKKDPFMMQIYADVVGKPIHVIAADQAGAMGIAMTAAAACGAFASLDDAVRAMVKPAVGTYLPNPANHAVYDELFAQYIRLHDGFSEADSVIKKLREIKNRT